MTYEAEAGNFSVALVGDLMMNRRVHGFGSLLSRRCWTSCAPPTSASPTSDADQRLRAQLGPEAGLDLVAGGVAGVPRRSQVDGIKAVTTSNNHSYDYNEAGLLTTMRHLEGARPALRGRGHEPRRRAGARADRLAPRARGPVRRVDHVQRAVGGRARRPDFPSPARINAAPREDPHGAAAGFDALVEARSSSVQGVRRGAPHLPPAPGGALRRGDRGAVPGPEVQAGGGYDTRTSCNRADLDGILKWIRGATKQADWLIYSTHCHEAGTPAELHEVHRPTPPEFLVEFAHWTIDQGCHAFTAHRAPHPPGIGSEAGRFSTASATSSSTTTPCSGSRIRRIGAGLGHEHTPGDWGPPARATTRTVSPWTACSSRAWWRSAPTPHRQLAEISPPPRGPRVRAADEPARPADAGRPGARERDPRRAPAPLEAFGTRINVENGVGVIKVAA